MPPPLPGPLAQLAPLLDDYGYLAVGVLVFFDNCAIPVPGQTILVLAAVYAGAGQLSLPVVVTVAVLAAFAGNGLAYLIGRTGGLAFVHRWGRYLRLTPERMARAEDFFRRRGTVVVAGARFVDGLRQTNGLVAGTTEMPLRRFLPANAAGAVLWSGVWAAVGYFAGSNITVLYRQAVRYQVLLLIAVVAVLALVGTRAWLRHRRRPPVDAGDRIPHQDSGEDVPADGRR
ncbi:DedA family protein [Kitasatospora griseola]|uniref:DedA family protein n=1 Tax=Kitasatospora griseola TaxID=2064 RepID=UPI003808AD94